jgi:hypothetical protein
VLHGSRINIMITIAIIVHTHCTTPLWQLIFATLLLYCVTMLQTASEIDQQMQVPASSRIRRHVVSLRQRFQLSPENVLQFHLLSAEVLFNGNGSTPTLVRGMSSARSLPFLRF